MPGEIRTLNDPEICNPKLSPVHYSIGCLVTVLSQIEDENKKMPHDSLKGALQCLNAAIGWLERYERETEGE